MNLFFIFFSLNVIEYRFINFHYLCRFPVLEVENDTHVNTLVEF